MVFYTRHSGIYIIVICACISCLQTLKGSRGSSPAVDLSIEDGDNEEGARYLVHIGLDDVRLEGARQRPAHIAGGVAHIASERVVADLLVVYERLGHNGHDDGQLLGQQEAASTQLGDGETRAVPRRVLFDEREQVDDGREHVLGHVLGQSVGDASDAFGGRPAHNCVLVLEAEEQLLDDLLDLVGYHLVDLLVTIAILC